MKRILIFTLVILIVFPTFAFANDKEELKPCPFCGGWPHLAARKTVTIDGISGKARYAKKEWFVEPGCKIPCFFYSVYVKAFPIVGGTNGLGFETRQAAIDAWNKRGGKA